MSRLKQNQNIDSLILSITAITKNRCSFSGKGNNALYETLTNLQKLRKKKGKTNQEVLQIVVPMVEILSEFFKNYSEDNVQPNTP